MKLVPRSIAKKNIAPSPTMTCGCRTYDTGAPHPSPGSLPLIVPFHRYMSISPCFSEPVISPRASLRRERSCFIPVTNMLRS